MKLFLRFIFVAIIVLGVFVYLKNKENLNKIQNIDVVIKDEKQKQEQVENKKLDYFELQKNILYKNVLVQTQEPLITGDEEIDLYIKQKAIDRGYELRQIANEDLLVSFSSQRLQKEALEEFLDLQKEAKELGLSIMLVSGYRSIEKQREIFNSKLGEYKKEDILNGAFDQKLDDILRQSSVPGYSKHHTGYTVDLGCGNYELTDKFKETLCYKWLSDDDFKNVRKYKFIPSYPETDKKQGPDPESWEFVYIPELIQ